MKFCSTPPWRIRLKARVDLGDQTVPIYTFKVISTTILTYFKVFLGINPRSLICAINTRFQPDAPRWCIILVCFYTWVRRRYDPRRVVPSTSQPPGAPPLQRLSRLREANTVRSEEQGLHPKEFDLRGVKSRKLSR